MSRPRSLCAHCTCCSPPPALSPLLSPSASPSALLRTYFNRAAVFSSSTSMICLDPRVAVEEIAWISRGSRVDLPMFSARTRERTASEQRRDELGEMSRGERKEERASERRGGEASMREELSLLPNRVCFPTKHRERQRESEARSAWIPGEFRADSCESSRGDTRRQGRRRGQRDARPRDQRANRPRIDARSPRESTCETTTCETTTRETACRSTWDRREICSESSRDLSAALAVDVRAHRHRRVRP